MRKSMMEKIINYTILIMNSLQYVVDGIINLCFQPLFILLQIIQQISELWKSDTTNTNDAEAEKTNNSPIVVQYPSANEGRPYPEEVESPACEHQIGFRINRDEQEQLEEIKKQLNK